MKKIYVIEKDGETVAVSETVCGGLDYLRTLDMIDYDAEASEFVNRSNDTDSAIKKMQSYNWEDNIYNLIEDKIYEELDECEIGTSYTKSIIIKETIVIE